MLFLTLTAAVSLAQTEQPETTTSSPADSTSTNTIVLRIERLTTNQARMIDTLDLVVESDWPEQSGFGLKLATNSRYLDIVEILPGEMYDFCNWQFFSARRQTQGLPGQPSVIWHAAVVATLGAVTDSTNTPICYRIDRPVTLMRIVVSSEHVIDVPDTTAAVFFYWLTCRDNVVSDVTGNLLVLSRSVTDYFPVNLPPETGDFPTRKGSPASCVKSNLANAPKRMIEFHNGGVKWEYDTPVDSASGR